MLIKGERTLGRFLKICRVKSGLTQHEVGKRINLSAQYVSNWERGLCDPPMNVLPILMRIYKIPRKALMAELLRQTKKTFSEILGPAHRSSKGHSA